MEEGNRVYKENRKIACKERQREKEQKHNKRNRRWESNRK